MQVPTHYTSGCNLNFLESLAPLPRQPRPTTTHAQTHTRHTHTDNNTGDRICHSLVYWTLQADRIKPPTLLMSFDAEEKCIVRKGLYKSKQMYEKT